jgi:hypothetical protein
LSDAKKWLHVGSVRPTLKTRSQLSFDEKEKYLSCDEIKKGVKISQHSKTADFTCRSSAHVKHNTFERMGGPLNSSTFRKKQFITSKHCNPYSGAPLPAAALRVAMAPDPPCATIPFVTHMYCFDHFDTVALGLNDSQGVHFNIFLAGSTAASMLANVLLMEVLFCTNGKTVQIKAISGMRLQKRFGPNIARRSGGPKK